MWSIIEKVLTVKQIEYHYYYYYVAKLRAEKKTGTKVAWNSATATTVEKNE